MTAGDIIAIIGLLLPGVHVLIRRFQFFDHRSMITHAVLFFAACWLVAGYAAGWSVWLAAPALVLVAAASQYRFRRDSQAKRLNK